MSTDTHGNKIAREGCDRCGNCGCKYWENDRCIDCGAHISSIFGEIRTASQANGWDVQEKNTPRGARYRYRCTSCGHTGRWVINPNDADGDDHLYAAHGQGE